MYFSNHLFIFPKKNFFNILFIFPKKIFSFSKTGENPPGGSNQQGNSATNGFGSNQQGNSATNGFNFQNGAIRCYIGTGNGIQSETLCPQYSQGCVKRTLRKIY
jgi:hypothetical protein